MFRIPSLLVVLAVLAPLPRAGAQEAGGEGESVHLGAKAAEEFDKTIKAKRAEFERQASEELANFKKAEQEKFAKATEARKITVKIGDREEVVDEPRDPAGEDLKVLESVRYRTWSLQPGDFKFDLPVEVFVSRAVGSKTLAGKDEVFMVLPFSVTNSLIFADIKDPEGKLIGAVAVNGEEELAELKAKVEKDRNSVESRPGAAALRLQFTMVTDKGVFVPEASGFVVREGVDFSTFTRRSWTKEMIALVRDDKGQNELQPGETRYGAAVFPRFDPESTEVRILVDGLNNEYDFKRDLRKVLVLEFVRPGNVYYPGQVKLALKRRVGGELMDPKVGYVPDRDEDVHRGHDWAMLWNWDAAIRIGDPKNSPEVPSPAGGDKFSFWSYKVTVPNRTGAEQPVSIEQVRTLVRVKLDVAGKEREVEVPLVDDGKMTVYKAAYFDQEAVPVADSRFPRDRRVEAAQDDQGLEFVVAFSDRDVDFDAVLANLHAQFDLELAIERNAQKEGERKGIFKGPRQLSVEEVAAVRDQLAKKLPDALKAQLAEKVVAEIVLKSGLSSGTRAVSYSLRKPAPVPAMPREE